MSIDSQLSAIDNMRKAGSEFSFSGTLVDNINNAQFAKNISYNYSDNDSTLQNVLSAVGDLLGSKMYEEVLNYIDNIGDIDICKTKALNNIASLFGVSYTAFSIIQNMPIELLHIMDMMSIAPEYLMMSEKTSKAFIDILSSNSAISDVWINEISSTSACNQLPNLSGAYLSAYYDDTTSNDISVQAKIMSYISSDGLSSFILNAYTTLMNAVLLSTYYDFDPNGSPILSTNVISCDLSDSPYLTYNTYSTNYQHKILNRSAEYTALIEELKSYYRIKKFDEQKAADDIQYGIHKFSDYSTHEKEIIDVELKWRALAYDAGSNLSRYAFYKALNVLKYIDFVESMYSKETRTMLSDMNTYELDNDYLYLSSNINTPLLIEDEDGNVQVQQFMIDNVAKQLLEITMTVRNIRNLLKSQALKISMKGTFLFLSYIVNEYIKQNAKLVFKKNVDPKINLIEYVDTTTYYNISTDVDNADVEYYDDATTNLLNQRYWESDGSIQALRPSDDTNMFTNLGKTASKNTVFTLKALEQFYIDVLNNKFGDVSSKNNFENNSNHLHKFLSAVFDSAADRTYKDISGNLCCFVDLTKFNKFKRAREDQLSTFEDSFYNETSGSLTKYKQEIVSLIDDLSVLTDSLMNDKLSALSSYLEALTIAAAEDVSRYVEKYNDGTLSDYFLNSVTSLTSASEIAALSIFTLQSLSASRYAELESTILAAKQISSESIAEMLTEFYNKALDLSDGYQLCASEASAQIQELSNELFGQALSDYYISCTSSITEYKDELYMKYGGLSTNENPFYYYKNTIHPSYWIHPYLSTFIDTYDFTYAIENMPVLEEETMLPLLSARLNNMIDDNGYLVSVWNSPFNRNADYLTHYERVSHVDYDNKDNPLIGYDGLAYPLAVSSMLCCYSKINSEDNPDNNRKIEIIRENISSWYSGLNMSDLQKNHIYSLINTLSSPINSLYNGSAYYDIFRYGKDIYGNSYSLVKYYYDENSRISTIDRNLVQNWPYNGDYGKKNTPGSLWIRLKNNPIAFPAYSLSSNLAVLSNIQQIDGYNTNRFTNSFYTNACFPNNYNEDNLLCGNGNCKCPAIYDFFLSKDRLQIAFYTLSSNRKGINEYKSTKYVAVAKIQQDYNYDENVDRYELFLETIQQPNNSNFMGEALDEDEHFMQFINESYNIGYISLISNSSDIILKRRVFYDPTLQFNPPEKLSVKLDGITQLSDVQLDICNDTIYVTHLSSTARYLSNGDDISAFFLNSNGTRNKDLIVLYLSLSDSIDVFNLYLIVLQYKVNNDSIQYLSNNTSCYLPFANMGFIPVPQRFYLSRNENHPVYLFSDAKFMESIFGFVKIQLMQKPIDIERYNGIKYMYCLDPNDVGIRKYENTSNQTKAISNYNIGIYSSLCCSCYSCLSAYNFNNFHIMEPNKDVFIELDQFIPKIKTDLTYKPADDLNITFMMNEKSDAINLFENENMPWLIEANNDIVDLSMLLNPGKRNSTDNSNSTYQNISIDVDYLSTNLSIFCITKDDDRISATWLKYDNGEQETIKIDFNTIYFLNLKNGKNNKYNLYMTFLNLDYPGAAGKLYTYTNDTDNMTIKHRYYIKNISNKYPQFIISCIT